MPNHIVLCFISCLLLSTPLSARIDVLQVHPNTDPLNCNGRVELIITGNAAPYEIFVVETGALFTGVDGPVILATLCTGEYTLEISTASNHACSHTLTVEILHEFPAIPPPPSNVNNDPKAHLAIAPGEQSEEPGQSQNLANQLLTESNIEHPIVDFSIYPNPTSEIVHVEFKHQDHDRQLLVIRNTFGQILYQQTVAPGTALINVDVSKYSSGLYFISLQQTPEQTETISKPLVIH